TSHPARRRVPYRSGLHRLPRLAAMDSRRQYASRRPSYRSAALHPRVADLRDGVHDGPHVGRARRGRRAQTHATPGRGPRAVIEALVGFAGFLALALLRVPMAFAMGIVGFA